MIGTTLQRSKTTRESKARALVFFLTLSVLVHGTFYPREWLLLSAGMALLSALLVKDSWAYRMSLTDGLFTGLIALSLIGLLNPIKVSEGWLDAIRWFTLWMVYRVSSTLREEQGQYVLHWIEGLGVLIAIVAWIPALSQIWPGVIPLVDGRLSSFFGYPNALAAYLAAVLLLRPRSKWMRALMFTSLLNTGSRASIGIFLVVWVCREVLLFRARRKLNHKTGKSNFRRLPKGLLRKLRDLLKSNTKKTSTTIVNKEGILFILLLIIGVLFTLRWNQLAVEHVLNWGISTSLGERLLYFRDGLHLAILNKGLPKAGGWYAFPLVQAIPYWTTDPHSLGVRILLHQGVLGVIFAGGWALWVLLGLGSKALRILRESRGEDLTYIKGFSALLFLMLHALLDTDYLFGALGLLFWTLFGVFSSSPKKLGWRKSNFPIESYYTQYQGEQVTRKIGILPSVLFGGIGLLLLTLTIHPQWIEQGNSIQPKTSQEAARLEVEQKGSKGLVAVESILAWEKFNLRTYEWAQGIVLAEAEKREVSDSVEAAELYHWVEKVPDQIGSVRKISNFEKVLWPEAEKFQPSEYNLLLAEYARKRQNTLR